MDVTSRERGPAEDLVARRLKPLSKKIQRFRNYATQPTDTLNADQRAAVAALPVHEAVARELEEIMKQMEEADLVAAARQREALERAAATAVTAQETAVKEGVASTAANVTAFMDLHALLRPARTSDHESLTFAPLVLPLALQDEVLATDILRVARMYEDLSSGGEVAHGVLAVLAAGPSGTNKEDDRVHHLLALLSSPDVDTATEVGSTAAEPAFSMRGDVSAAPTEYGGDGDASSETGAYANGNGVADEYDNDYDDPQRTPVMSVAGLRGASLNFLQEDELALPAPQVDVNFRAVHAQHEVIEPASAVNSEAAQTASTPRTPLDCTAEEAGTSADDLAAALSAGGAIEVDAVTVAVESVTLVDAAPAAPSPAPAKGRKDGKSERKEGKDGKERKRRPQRKDGDKKDGQSERKEQSERKDGGERKERAPRAKGKPSAAAVDTAVDSDGFEIKVSRRASTTMRGRGAPGRGRGRGGAPREGRPNQKEGDVSATATPRKANGANGKRENKEQTTPKPKNSIYKEKQPTGPVSAPLL